MWVSSENGEEDHLLSSLRTQVFDDDIWILIKKGRPTPMKDAARRRNVEYGFNLTEEEIDLVARQAEEAALLFQPLFEVDVTGITPLTKVDKRIRKTSTTRKGKK